jgi:hypothetical protein
MTGMEQIIPGRTRTDLRAVCLERIEHALFRIDQMRERLHFVHSDTRSTTAERESVKRLYDSTEREFYIQHYNVARLLPVVKAAIEYVDKHKSNERIPDGFERLAASVMEAEGECPGK